MSRPKEEFRSARRKGMVAAAKTVRRERRKQEIKDHSGPTKTWVWPGHNTVPRSMRPGDLKQGFRR